MRSSHEFVFYAYALNRDARQLELESDEHHHLARVLRMSVGETVFVSNGTGVIVRCSIDAVERERTRLSVVETIEDRSSDTPLILALAILKKEAFELAVKQCSELGVTHFIPFVAERSHLKKYSPAYVERLRRIALSAMKQSFRSVLPIIDQSLSFDDVVSRVADGGPVVVGDADAVPVAGLLSPRPSILVVGPEGGLTDDEYRRLDAEGYRRVSVSAKRLRSETAAAALVTLVGLDPAGSVRIGQPD